MLQNKTSGCVKVLNEDLVLMRTKLLKWSSFSLPPHFFPSSTFSPLIIVLHGDMGSYKNSPIIMNKHTFVVKCVIL